MNEEKTNVLIFTTNYLPAVGGAEIAVREITNRIDAEGVQFDMITPRLDSERAKEETVGNVTVHRIGFGSWIDKLLLLLVGVLKAMQIHRKKSVDTCWGIMVSYSGIAATFFSYLHPSVRYVLTLQAGDPLEEIEEKFRWAPWLLKRVFLQADHIHAISTYLKDWAREIGYEGPVDVIPNGVDIELFTKEYSQESLKEITDELQKEESEKTRYLITTSRLVKKNGLRDVIRALPKLPEYVAFIILGTGPLESDLKDLASKLEVRERVHFLGLKPHQELPRYLQLADIFIRPSRSEGMGNSFIEAMAAGIPVIGTPVGGITDFLKDRETGILVEPERPDQIARAVNMLLRDLTLREEIAISARELVEEKYNWDAVATQLKKVLTK